MLDPHSREFEDRFRARYEALLPVPAFPGDRTWLDRVCTWEEFRDRGHYVALMVANMMRADAEEWERAEITAAPELARLVIEAFAESSGPDTRPQ
jgi:hypothetical protein